MRELSEIQQNYRLQILDSAADGLACIYRHPTLRKPLQIIASWGGQWEHVSVSLPNRCPTWDEMCAVKEAFWKDDEVVMQLHPAKAEYVNDHEYCLHLWKPMKAEIPTPPSFMVGLRKGQTKQEILREAEEYFRKVGE